MDITERNILVFQDTYARALDEFEDATDNALTTLKVYAPNELKRLPQCKDLIEIMIVEGTTVNMGLTLFDITHNRTAILNFADGVVPGGRVFNGSRAQEETICRCSNLYPLLSSEKAMDYYDMNRANYNEGLCTDGIIYTRDVLIFKDDCTYKDIEPTYLDVITCPAPSCVLEEDVALSVYYTRISKILRCAYDNGARNLVLGAWGCGAFGQDPYIMAKAFAKVLSEVSGHFSEILFAIPRGVNYETFNAVLHREYKGRVDNVV